MRNPKLERRTVKEYETWPRLVKQENGYYYALYKDEGGQKHRASLKTQNFNEASTKYNRLLENVAKGILGFDPNPKAFPCSQAIEKYLKEGTADLAPTTLQRYKEAINNHLKPYFGKMSLRAVKPSAVLAYVRFRQAKKVAPFTIHKELNVLSAIFNFHLQEEAITYNPVLAVKKPKIRIIRPHYTPTETELFKILDHLFKGAKRFFLAFANTGCRLSEISNANVRDADLKNGFLRVVRKGGKVNFLKMNAVLRQVIEEELAEREEVKPDQPLFLNQYGTRYKKMRKALKTACEEAKVPHCTHHSLRHAYVTILHEKGKDIGTISKLLGHANPTITQNIYIHWRDQEVHQAAMEVEVCGQMLQKSAKSGK
jgi:integrase